MTGSKLQVAVLTTVVVSGAVLFQTAMPRLANNATFRYLKAEYKLATGDTGSALKLMQQDLTPQKQAPAKAAETSRAETTPQCRRVAAAKPVVAPKPAMVEPSVVSRLVPDSFRNHISHRVVISVPSKWTLQQARIMAQITLQQDQANRHMEQTMKALEAKLRTLPVTPVAPPSIPVVDVEPR